jgi:hypothetical protein
LGEAVREYGLGRLPSPPDARDYSMKAAMVELDKTAPPRPVKSWHSDRVLNQLKTPHCVGFAWAGWGISSPVEDDWNNCTGHDIYSRCKQVDGCPEKDGSTVRAGAKVMKQMGRLGTYFWAGSVDEALDYVSRFGPVVFGTIFTEGMCRPSLIGGIIRPTGKVVGGHAYDIVGVDEKYATIKQSWGLKHGKGGYVRLSIVDLEDIYMQGGEACAATERALPIGGANA